MNTMIFEQPTVLVYNSTLFMYYDYGTSENSVGLATGDIVDGIIGITKGEGRITNYPNPFRTSTTFRYTLEEPTDVTMQIINSLGQVVATLTPGIQAKGEQQVTWDAAGLPAGVYTCRIFAGKWVGNGEMVKW